MSDLAYNINGEGFELPETATGWRVRRMKPRGAPEVVYGKDGLPLIIPIESDLEELRRSVDSAGRFRLDAVDERDQNIKDIPAAYIVVPHKHDATHAPVVTEAVVPRAPINGADSVVAEAMRLNTELARSVIDRFPEMMQAAAMVLRAADGAGLPAREPRGEHDEELEDDEAERDAKPGFDLHALVAQLVPMLIMNIGGKGKLPGLGEMLDWRRAAPAAQPRMKTKATKPAQEAKVDTSTVPENATDVLPPIDPTTMAHFVAVQSALSPEESAIAREVAKELSATELRAWFDELSKLSVPDAVVKVRKLISGYGKAGGVS